MEGAGADDASRSFPCHWKDCTDAFSSSESLRVHLSTHQNASPLVCLWDECPRYGKHQPSKCAFVAHLKKHSGDRPFRCTKCERSYTRSDALHKHIKAHNTNERTLEEIKGRIKFLNEQFQTTVDLLGVLENDKARAFSRLRLCSSICIGMIAEQVKEKAAGDTQGGAFWDKFLGRK